LGLAVMEEVQLRDGHVRNASFTDYLLPTTLDMPPVVSVLIEHPHPDAPYGAKGVGEPPTISSTPAIVAAIRAATGRELNRVPTGTGLVARAVSERYGCEVVGLDPSGDMLSAAVARNGHIPLVRARAESLPFPDESFDHLTFTYLLRYVDDPAATMRELARVVRPGGSIVALDFGVPTNPILRMLWRVHTSIGLPTIGRAISPQWASVGAFLKGSIERFNAAHPQHTLE